MKPQDTRLCKLGITLLTLILKGSKDAKSLLQKRKTVMGDAMMAAPLPYFSSCVIRQSTGQDSGGRRDTTESRRCLNRDFVRV